MRNPLQTKEWVKEIIRVVSEWNEKHREVVRIHQPANSLHNKNCIRESERKITHRLRRIVLRVAREHLRNEKPLRSKDLRELFCIIDAQKKEINQLKNSIDNLMTQIK